MQDFNRGVNSGMGWGCGCMLMVTMLILLSIVLSLLAFMGGLAWLFGG
jgi:hypothetical protein